MFQTKELISKLL